MSDRGKQYAWLAFVMGCLLAVGYMAFLQDKAIQRMEAKCKSFGGKRIRIGDDGPVKCVTKLETVEVEE